MHAQQYAPKAVATHMLVSSPPVVAATHFSFLFLIGVNLRARESSCDSVPSPKTSTESGKG